MSRKSVAAAVVAIALFAAGCGSDDDAADSTTTAKPTTTTEATTTTAPAPKQTVETKFAAPATPEQATQAAQVMTKRLTNFGYPGSVAVVNGDSTGLTIAVVGVETMEEAIAVVQPLTANGALYFRPVLQGPIAPAEGESPSPTATETLNEVSPGSTVPGSQIATTPPAEDQPDGESVLAQLDKDLLVIARWEVGPQQADASAVASAKPTTHNDVPAVQIVMKEGSPGIDQFNALAEQCWAKEPTCPTDIYTVVFDSVVLFASLVQPDDSSFTPYSTTDVIIWNPDWTEDRANTLAALINVGQMPVQLVLA